MAFHFVRNPASAGGIPAIGTGQRSSRVPIATPLVSNGSRMKAHLDL
jgi:hypothetical protein